MQDQGLNKMKILDRKIVQGDVWFHVELDRNTDVVAQELFTQSDVEHFKKEAVREFLDKLLENNT